MALTSGNEHCSNGMAQDIWNRLLSLPDPNPYKQMEHESSENYAIRRENMQQLIYAIAHGVIEHITNNMEISGIEVTVPSGDHLIAAQAGVMNTSPKTRTQSNPGTGLVS